MSTSSSLVELAKRAAAFKAVEEHILPLITKKPTSITAKETKSVIEDTIALGIGSGSTVVHAVERLKQFKRDTPANQQRSFVCIPTSFQSRQLVLEAKLQLSDLESYPRLKVCIDGADDVDSKLNCIKGGGGCQLQEKIVAYNSESLIIIADYRKLSDTLGAPDNSWKQGVPIEVVPMAYNPVMCRLRQEFDSRPVLRMAKVKAGPCITDNGNMIIDCDFGEIKDPEALERRLISIPGVVETGLFVNMAKKAYFGMQDG